MARSRTTSHTCQARVLRACAVKIHPTVLCVISPGMFGRVLSTRLALVPRLLWIVAICIAASFSERPLDIRYNSHAIFHSFHTPARLRLSISNSEGDWIRSMSELGVRKVSFKEILVPCYEYERKHVCRLQLQELY